MLIAQSGKLIGENWANTLYLLASVLFILGIKGLTHPRTAVRGNLTSAAGMLCRIPIVFITLEDSAWP